MPAMLDTGSDSVSADSDSKSCAPTTSRIDAVAQNTPVSRHTETASVSSFQRADDASHTYKNGKSSEYFPIVCMYVCLV